MVHVGVGFVVMVHEFRPGGRFDTSSAMTTFELVTRPTMLLAEIIKDLLGMLGGPQGVDVRNSIGGMSERGDGRSRPNLIH